MEAGKEYRVKGKTERVGGKEETRTGREGRQGRRAKNKWSEEQPKVNVTIKLRQRKKSDANSDEKIKIITVVS